MVEKPDLNRFGRNVYKTSVFVHVQVLSFFIIRPSTSRPTPSIINLDNHPIPQLLTATMQPTAMFTILALAATGLAAPTEQSVSEVAARTTTPSEYCTSTNTNYEAYCCNSGGFLGGILQLACTVTTGNTCSSGDVYCCNANGDTVCRPDASFLGSPRK